MPRSDLCKHCGQPLNKSQWRKGGEYKSCPAHSTENGQEHVFLPFPQAFGMSDAREASGAVMGAQSHCQGHRSKGAGLVEGIRCSEVKR